MIRSDWGFYNMAGVWLSSGRRHGRAARPGVRAMMAIAIIAGLASCAGNRFGYLVPVAGDGGATTVHMLAVTTRAPSEDAGVAFSGERGEEVSFADIAVSLPPGRKPGTVQWPRTSPGNPQTDFVVTSMKPMDRAGLPAWFTQAGGDHRRVFVYVHGFNTRFDRAVFRMAQLTYDSDVNAAPVLYSWPSRGQVLDYRRDLDNASYSRSDLANLLEVASNSSAVDEIVILAHSMGSWVAVEALRQIALEKGGVPPKITNLILASPDLDIGVFRRQVQEMGQSRPSITLFVSQADRALRLSAVLSRGATRLGSVNLEDENYRRELGDLDGVTVLDLTALKSGDRINHSVYAKSPEVVRLIGERLIEGQVITDTGVSPIDTLGNAAGLAATAPIRVFEAGRR
jgi:esterase/lipase superfamily enzyme